MATMAAWTRAFGFDYLAYAWLEGPLRLHEDALGPWTEDIARWDPALSRQVAGAVRALDDPAESEIATREFQRCIVVPVPGRYVPPYASVHLDASKSLWGAVTRQVLSWYDDAGLDWVGHSSRYPWVRAPDHIGVECAFAAELWAATGDGGRAKVDAGHALVAGHLPEWVPRYVAEVRERVAGSYWLGMTGLLQSLVSEGALQVRSEPGVAVEPVVRGAVVTSGPARSFGRTCEVGARPAGKSSSTTGR